MFVPGLAVISAIPSPEPIVIEVDETGGIVTVGVGVGCCGFTTAAAASTATAATAASSTAAAIAVEEEDVVGFCQAVGAVVVVNRERDGIRAILCSKYGVGSDRLNTGYLRNSSSRMSDHRLTGQ